MKENLAPRGSDAWKKIEDENAWERAKARGISLPWEKDIINKTPAENERHRPHRSEMEEGT